MKPNEQVAMICDYIHNTRTNATVQFGNYKKCSVGYIIKISIFSEKMLGGVAFMNGFIKCLLLYW